MPLLVYFYCILLSFSAAYGVYILKPKPAYLVGAALFVLFCWLVCIDYYLVETWIFTSQIALVIYFICAIFWQAIEMKAVRTYMAEQNYENMAALESMQEEFDQNKNLMPILSGILFGIALIFYFPILYMGYEVFINISG